MRIALLAIGIVLLAVGASAQVTNDPELLGQLKKLFPDAATFSAKSGTPAHYKAFGPAAAGQQEGALLGLAYWTTELEPLERGFDGPIKMLVGMDTAGEITGVIVTDHREPYGYFSVDLPEWPKQFEGKSIRDAFKVGADVDAISRATITVTSASRADAQRSRQGRARLSRAAAPPRGRHRAPPPRGPVSRLLERSCALRRGRAARPAALRAAYRVASAQPQADEPPAEPADDAGWNFDDEDEEAAPTLLELAREQALDIGLFAGVRGARDGELPPQERAAEVRDARGVGALYGRLQEPAHLDRQHVRHAHGATCRCSRTAWPGTRSRSSRS